MTWFNDLAKDIKREPLGEILFVCFMITLLSFFGLAVCFAVVILVIEFPWLFIIFIPASILLYLRFVYKVPE